LVVVIVVVVVIIIIVVVVIVVIVGSFSEVQEKLTGVHENQTNQGEEQNLHILN